MLSKRVQRVAPSPTLTIDAKAKAMKAEGKDVVNFGVGEPDFGTPENIKQAAIKAINDGHTRYTPAPGIMPLREAVANKFKADNGLDYKPEQIIVSCGAKHSLYNIMQAILDPGDEVIIPAPYWVSYPAQVLLNDATPVVVPTKEANSFMLDVDALEAAVTPKTKALILNSPSNPTGQAYDLETLKKVAEVAVKHNFYVITDEVYEKLVYDGTEHISIASLSDEIKNLSIVVNGISKSHCMTGWRIGFTAGPLDVIKAMSKIQGQSTSNPTSISQWAAIEALTGPQDFFEPMRVEFQKRRDVLVAGLNAIDGITCQKPSGAFYVFPNTSALYGNKVKSSSDLAMYLLEDANVALVPGDAFGDDNYVRISYATSMDDINKALSRIKEASAKLG